MLTTAANSRLAELMLPDGVHMRTDDSTFFYLGQHPSTSIASLLSSEPIRSSSVSRHSETEDGSLPPGLRSQDSSGNQAEKLTPGSPGAPLLYVMNCVRCQMNKEVKRGAEVKAMAIASPVPWLEVWRVSRACIPGEDYIVTSTLTGISPSWYGTSASISRRPTSRSCKICTSSATV